MKLNELYEYFGSWTQLTRELNLSSATYQIWRRKGYIPFKAQLLIENKSKGRFKAVEAHGEPIVKKPGIDIAM
jgi:hypothetical protein